MSDARIHLAQLQRDEPVNKGKRLTKEQIKGQILKNEISHCIYTRLFSEQKSYFHSLAMNV